MPENTFLPAAVEPDPLLTWIENVMLTPALVEDSEVTESLVPDTYRIFDCTGVLGNYYELEIDEERIVLQEAGLPQSKYEIRYQAFRAEALARLEIARRYGQAAAAGAHFVIGWD
jgi:hypothetical protein